MTKHITKDQIQKGDRIRVTIEERYGVSMALTGTADSKDADGDWKTKDNGYLTLEYDDISALELLVRPLPAEPGTVFRATEIRGEKCDVVVLVCELHWCERAAFYVSHKRVQGSEIHLGPEHITAWEPIDD